MEPARAEPETMAGDNQSVGTESTMSPKRVPSRHNRRNKPSSDGGKKIGSIGGSSGGGSAHGRRGSVGALRGTSSTRARRASLSMLANQLRMFEAEKAGAACVRETDNIQQLNAVLDSVTFLACTAVASTAALLLAIFRTVGRQEWLSSDELWAAQLLLAVAATLELTLRLYACGPSYCSNWISLWDTYVIVGGVCLALSSRSGSAALFLRIVRVAAVGQGWFTADGVQNPAMGDLDTNPAVQLYQFMMRAISEPTHIFTPAEKKVLRGLLSLLAHQRIYVDANLQRANEDYWKEYGHEDDRPRGRPSFALFRDSISLPEADVDFRISPSSGWASPVELSSSSSLHSPAATTHMLDAPAIKVSGKAEGQCVRESIQNDAVVALLAKVDQWDFDPFGLEEVSQGHPLVALTSYLFAVKYNFFSCFAISKPHFDRFMAAVERGYGSGKGAGVTNIYHSRRHAADVTQAVHYFLTVCNLGQHLRDVEVVALLLGAVIHDFKHPGKSNAFLTKTGHDLALTYNDVSILENYHISEAFFLLKKDECNFFRHVSLEISQEVRHIMVSMVLATDLKQHFDVLGEFNSHLADVQEGAPVNEGTSKTYTCAMKVCIKSADISHPARATNLHLRWTRDVIQEFFLQGDEEKKLGLEPSPLCDRDNTDIASSQKNFIGFLVNPLFESWVSFLDCPAAELCSANLKKNEAMWAAKEKMGDDSLDFVAVPEASAVSPESPPKVHPRRSSVARAINFLRGGAGGARGDGNSTGGVSGRADEHDDGCANSHAAAEAARASVAGANSQSSTSIEDGTDACAELEEGTCGRRRCLGLQGVGGMSGAALGVVQVGSCGGVTATDLAAPAMGREPGPTTPPGACRVLEDVNRGGRRDRDTGESILPARRFSLEKVFPPPPGSSSS